MSDGAPRGAPPPGYQTVSPYLLYEDTARAVEYLVATFGFVERLEETGAAGRKHHELLLGDDGLVMLGQAWPGFRSARTVGEHPSALVHVYVDDVEALHERAKAEGAEVSELEVAPVGDKRFSATDPEGQVWYFSQRTVGPKR
ncbi:glyoxalase [soil metagenome]